MVLVPIFILFYCFLFRQADVVSLPHGTSVPVPRFIFMVFGFENFHLYNYICDDK
ncbi:hypothetical protein HanRHA438_Chr13g0579471 [Helianthus annuus]|nr:hypothetical protein HanRHA438_Chr13g0579471 [Helianthus annuus]